MPRLFISHSNKDSIHALAFQRWLELKGWARDDVFIDLHDMQAGERWRETLVKANVACEALLFLASPESLASDECLREVRRAQDDRKDVIVAILRDVIIDHPRLADFRDRQIVDLSTNPREERVKIEHKGQRHLIDFNHAALNAIHVKLIDWGIAPNAFAWPPRHNPKALPYPGLDAFDEYSAGIFFGREADVMAGIRELRQIRHRGSPRLLVIQAASGAGKSSFLRAGLWPRLGRAAEFVPLAVIRPATGIITGQRGLGQGLSQWFGERRRQVAPGKIHAELMDGDVAAGAQRLAAHMSAAVALVAEEQALNLAEGQAPPRLSPLIAIDQGEELFAAEDAAQSNRFLDMMGRLLGSPPAGLDPYVLVTIRADIVDVLLQRVPTLGLVTPHTILLPPLSSAAYRDIITKPAAVYTRQVARLDLEPELVEALVKGASGADALPLLAFTLQRLFLDYAPEQTLTKAHYDAMGGIEGSIDRKLAEAKAKAGTAGTNANLHRLIVPALATWDPGANAAKRLVAKEADLNAGDRAALAPLANALVDARLLTRGRDTIEVAHESLLRRPPIASWLDEHKDALKLRDDVLKEAKEWADRGEQPSDLVRRGERLRLAEQTATSPIFNSALAPASNYLAACRREEDATARAAGRRRAAIYTLMVGVIVALTGVIFKEQLLQRWDWYIRAPIVYAREVWHYVKSDAEEAALKTGDMFRDCAETSDVCQDMVVIPAGSFVMGSPDGETPVVGLEGKPKVGSVAPAEKGRQGDEGPQHEVSIARFAVAKFDVTWEAWDRCVALGGCSKVPTDQGFGRGKSPLINVTWDEAKVYIDWLSRLTGKSYRLLTEAEWEYAARAGTQTIYYFGDAAGEICTFANVADQSFKRRYAGEIADCDDRFAATSPTGSFPPNRFGLYDMAGNVFQWVQDCYVDSYADAPSDGSAVRDKEGCFRVLRGGSWIYRPVDARAAGRFGVIPGARNDSFGFRVARSLSPARTP